MMKRKYYILLLLFVLVTFFANLGALPTDIMESRNIVTGREMVATNNWLVPTMNGELRLAKPPLPTWVAGCMEEIAPGSLAVQRMAAGVMGCLWTLFLFLTARYISKRDDFAVASVIVFLTCYNLVLMGRSATWDIYCHAFMMAAVYYLTRALYEEHHALQWFVIAGLMMGLSFLSKGPVSFYTILLPYAITLLAFPQPDMHRKWGGVALMLVVMVVVGCWWYVYLLIQHPVEASSVFNKESDNWSSHNVRPWYYYWRFFLEMGLWAILMLVSLACMYWKKHIDPALQRTYLITITWAIACLVLLSLMPEKKTRYLLPLLAPCSMVVAALVIHFKQGDALDRVSKFVYRFNGYIVSAIVISVPFLSYFFGLKRGVFGWPVEIIVTVFMLAIAWWLLQNTRKFQPMRFISGIAAVFAVAEIFLLPAVGNAFGNPQEHSIHQLTTRQELDNIPFYHSDKEPLRIEIVYAANRRILPLNLKDEKTVMEHLPMIVVTRDYVVQELPASLLGKIDTVAYGYFDDNKHSKKDKHYNRAFLNHVTLLKTK